MQQQAEKQQINEFELVLIANHLLQEHSDYREGVRVSSVFEQDDVLVFKGECFLDANGLPTEHSPTAFNLYKWLAHELSPKFTLSGE